MDNFLFPYTLYLILIKISIYLLKNVFRCVKLIIENKRRRGVGMGQFYIKLSIIGKKITFLLLFYDKL